MKKIISSFLTSGLLLLSSCQNNPLGTESKSGANFFPGLGLAPLISSVSPNNGPIAGGTNITINGKNFTSRTKVKVGGISCSQITFYDPTRIVCMTPSHSLGIKDIYIENVDQQKFTLSGVFTYVSNINGIPGFGISSGGQRAVGSTMSMTSVMGEPIQSETMLGVTTQLRVGVGGILFSPE